MPKELLLRSSSILPFMPISSNPLLLASFFLTCGQKRRPGSWDPSWLTRHALWFSKAIRQQWIYRVIPQTWRNAGNLNVCTSIRNTQKIQWDCYYERFNTKTASRIFWEYASDNNLNFISSRDFGTTKILHLLFSLSTEISAVWIRLNRMESYISLMSGLRWVWKYFTKKMLLTFPQLTWRQSSCHFHSKLLIFYSKLLIRLTLI